MNVNREYISTQNTYRKQNVPKYIVVHETDNWSAGADAKRHAQAQAAGHLDTSVHYYSGSDGVYQAADHSDGTYSIGRDYGGGHAVLDAGNRNTINVEICVNVDGNYDTARDNAIELVRYLIQTTGIPGERVIRHYDAKGKYCPRNMMDHPDLWKDFKAQIGYRAEPEPGPVSPGIPEVWYRVGTGWSDGICQGQTGAYRNLDFAVADCKEGQNVYDMTGKILHSGGSGEKPAGAGYTQVKFIMEVQKSVSAVVDGVAGDETIGKTVTVSAVKNRKHAAVTPLQRRLNALGYDCGTPDGIAGTKFTAAVTRYQTKVLGYSTADGEITAGKKMWKSLLGMI